MLLHEISVCFDAHRDEWPAFHGATRAGGRGQKFTLGREGDRTHVFKPGHTDNRFLLK